MRLCWVHNSVLAAVLLAAAQPVAARSSEADGPLGLVVVSGGSYRQERDVARLAEDILHRLDSLSGRTRATPVKPLVRIALPDSEWGTPALIRSVPHNGLPWRFEVRGDVRESFSDLAAHLARLDISLWTDGGGQSVPQLDWLAVGLAENLSATRKARNREWTLMLAEEGRLPSLERILTWRRMPDGPMLEKAACGHAVGWMLAARGQTNLLDSILDQARRNGRVTADWLLPVLAGTAGEDPETAWRTEASRRDVIAGGGRPASALLFRQFREAIRTPASELGFAPARELTALSPWQLLAIRREPGVRQAAQARARSVRQFAVGAPPEIRDIALRYQAVFERVAGRVPAFWLRRRLRQADRALRELEDLTLARAAWLDRLEGEAAAIETARAGIFARSALERYMDEAEARLEAEDQAPPPKE